MLVLIGAGTTQHVVEELNREIERLGLQNDVLLTGGLASGSPELIGLIQQARVFTLSSTAEPFGIVILEAWAAGTPVISSLHLWASIDLIDHGRTGLLYDLETPSTLFIKRIDDGLQGCQPAPATFANKPAPMCSPSSMFPASPGELTKVYGDLREEVARRPKPLRFCPKPSQNQRGKLLDPMTTPLISIVMRSYNEAWALKETLPALAAQDHPNVELIVIDSGSTDGSQDLIRSGQPRAFHPDHTPGIQSQSAS